MKYKSFARELIKFLLLATIPIILIFAIKFNWNDIIPIVIPMVIYLQFILIWAQAEIGLRQHIMFTMQFDPSFKIEVEKEAGVIHDINRPNKVIVTNISQYPAYNIFVGRVLDEQNNPIAPSKWKKEIVSNMLDCLSPEQELLLCHISEPFINNKSVIEIIYTNKFGDEREFFIRFMEGKKHLFIPGKIKRPGILLNTFENLNFYFKYIRLKLDSR